MMSVPSISPSLVTSVNPLTGPAVVTVPAPCVNPRLARLIERRAHLSLCNSCVVPVVRLECANCVTNHACGYRAGTKASPLGAALMSAISLLNTDPRLKS